MNTNKMKLFYSLSLSKKLLFLEAFLMLGWARCMKQIKFQKLTKILRIDIAETGFQTNDKNKLTILGISEAIHIMSRYTLWESMCLVRAIAAMKMLERRGISSTLYLGTGKDENGQLIAHAWLRSGNQYVTGGEEMKEFAVVGSFAKIKHAVGDNNGS
jgi:hypothetical protein